MRYSMKLLAVAATLVAGLAGANALHAQDAPTSNDKPDSMMGSGMMGNDGMMKMMSRMSEMMENCNNMMQAMNMKSEGHSDMPMKPKMQQPDNQG
ncbi:hypothetical protein [Geminicoccus roseus]|uniref:hypothetical protein n=1 Tax=Geminicoccus roseus TaxID=404900 RepID=UPI0012F767B0|nr:hypothetical protein [Geminicoccus roseus]